MLFDMSKMDPINIYKVLVSTVVPRPIAWVTTLEEDGSLNAAPFSFFNAMSGNPPVICFGIGGRKPGDAKDTGNNIRRTGEFVVNLVSDALAEAMNITAIDFEPNVNEFHEAGLTPAPCLHVKPPRILESPVAMECKRLVIVDVGIDRSVVMGTVMAIHVHDDCVLDADKFYIDTPKLDLVGRMHGRGWYTRTRDRFEMPRIEVSDWNVRGKQKE
ncbi:MAG: flavin reductase family protein [Acetobacteraceae bacterium]|nr:flavin reductase family protein [Acetobacteraceae bacterium]